MKCMRKKIARTERSEHRVSLGNGQKEVGIYARTDSFAIRPLPCNLLHPFRPRGGRGGVGGAEERNGRRVREVIYYSQGLIFPQE